VLKQFLNCFIDSLVIGLTSMAFHIA